MEFIWIRHGMTKGNREKRYVGGRTDEGLCAQGRQALEEMRGRNLYPEADRVYISPMKRCLETAAILYPDREGRIVEGFRECDFGLFENKNDEELSPLPFYRDWVNGNGKAPFPEGEDPKAFKRRCRQTLIHLMAREEMPGKTAFVVHGGVIMAVLSGLCEERKDFYAYYTDNRGGYTCTVDMTTGGLVLRHCRKLFETESNQIPGKL